MDLVGAEALFEFAPDFFLKPGSDRRVGLGDVEAERSFAGLLGLLVSDDAVRLHLAEDEIAAAQSLVGIEERRIGDRTLGQSGEQGGFGQSQVFGVLC